MFNHDGSLHPFSFFIHIFFVYSFRPCYNIFLLIKKPTNKTIVSSCDYAITFHMMCCVFSSLSGFCFRVRIGWRPFFLLSKTRFNCLHQVVNNNMCVTPLLSPSSSFGNFFLLFIIITILMISCACKSNRKNQDISCCLRLCRLGTASFRHWLAFTFCVSIGLVFFFVLYLFIFRVRVLWDGRTDGCIRIIGWELGGIPTTSVWCRMFVRLFAHCICLLSSYPSPHSKQQQQKIINLYAATMFASFVQLTSYFSLFLSLPFSCLDMHCYCRYTTQQFS